MAKTKQTGLSVLLSLNTQQFSKGIMRASRQMQQFGKKMQAAGRSMSQNMTLPLVAAGAAAVKTAANFEFAMAKVQSVSGFAAEEIQRLSSQARRLGASTSKSASEVAELQFELAKLGKSSKEIENMTESVLSLAIAFDQELGEAAMSVGEVMAQFQIDSSETARVADVMAVAFGQSALDMTTFSEAMKNAGPVANAFGMSLEETTAILGVLANNGIKGSDAGTKLKMALSQIAASGDDVKQTFYDLIQGNISYADAINALGKRAAILAPILGKNGEQLGQLREKLMDSSGAARAARVVLEETAKGGFDRLRSATEAAGIELGKTLMPIVKQATEALTGLAESLASMTREEKEATLKTAGLAAAAGPLALVIGKVSSLIGRLIPMVVKLGRVLIANPYVAAALAIAFLGKKLYDSATALTSYEKNQQRVQAASKRAEELAKKEAIQVKLLREKYKLAGDDLEKRKKVLDELKAINPKIVEGLTAEKTSYDDLSSSIDTYVSKLKEQIRMKVLEEELIALIEEELILEQRLAEAQLQSQEAQDKYNATLEKRNKLEAVNGDTKALDILLEGTRTDAVNDSAAAVADLEEQLAANRKTQAELTKDTAEHTANTKAATKAEKELEEAKKKHREENERRIAQDEQSKKNLEEYIDLVQRLENAEKRRMENIQNATLGTIVEIEQDEEEPIDEDLGFTPRQEKNLIQGVETAKRLQAELNAALQGMVVDLATNIAAGIGAALAGAASLQDVGRIALVGLADMLISVGKLAIQTGVAVLGIKAALESLNPVLAIAGGVALIALGAGVKANLQQQVPAFAEGGAVLGPTLALVGEKAGSKGEAIVPFEKMTDFARKAIDQDALGGSNNVTVTGRISGSDIVISNARGGRSRSRF